MAAGFKTATVNAADVPSTQTNFPAYVDLSRLGITTLAEAQSVRVYADSGKTTEWAREIVNATEMHVKVPSLTSTVAIYVDWDGTSSDYGPTDPYGRNAVWSDFAGVWHGDDTTDSKAGTNNLTKTGASATYSAGKLGNAFTTTSASGQYWRTSSSPSGLPTGKPNMTYSFWINWSSVGANNFAVTYGTDANNQAYFAPGSSGSSPYKWATFWAGGSGFGSIVSGTTIATSTWFHVVTTYDQSTHRMYRDGAADGSVGYTNSNIINNYFNIMKHPAVTTNGVNGQVDEVRVRASVASADWITTEYNNQSDEPGFWGTWSDVGGGSTIKTYLGVVTANVKTVLNGTAIANRKTWNGIA